MYAVFLPSPVIISHITQSGITGINAANNTFHASSALALTPLASFQYNLSSQLHRHLSLLSAAVLTLVNRKRVFCEAQQTAASISDQQGTIAAVNSGRCRSSDKVRRSLIVVFLVSASTHDQVHGRGEQYPTHSCQLHMMADVWESSKCSADVTTVG